MNTYDSLRRGNKINMGRDTETKCGTECERKIIQSVKETSQSGDQYNIQLAHQDAIVHAIKCLLIRALLAIS